METDQELTPTSELVGKKVKQVFYKCYCGVAGPRGGPDPAPSAAEW